MPEILVASADQVFLDSLRLEAESQGFSLRAQDKIERILDGVKNRLPQILIVDFDLHEQPPWDILASLRQYPKAMRLPILIVSGRHTAPRTMISGLRLGAVEYHLKPCDPRVLMARISALLTALQRPKAAPQDAVFKTNDGGLIIDVQAHRCTLMIDSRSSEIRLTPKEFLLLSLLLSQINRLVSKEDMLRLLSPDHHKATKETVMTLTQHITRLRAKLGSYKNSLKTIWGLGYRFDG